MAHREKVSVHSSLLGVGSIKADLTERWRWCEEFMAAFLSFLLVQTIDLLWFEGGMNGSADEDWRGAVKMNY